MPKRAAPGGTPVATPVQACTSASVTPTTLASAGASRRSAAGSGGASVLSIAGWSHPCRANAARRACAPVLPTMCSTLFKSSPNCHRQDEHGGAHAARNVRTSAPRMLHLRVSRRCVSVMRPTRRAALADAPSSLRSSSNDHGRSELGPTRRFGAADGIYGPWSIRAGAALGTPRART